MFVDISLFVFAEGDNDTSVPLCDFHLLSIEAEMIQQTYDLNIQLRLGGLSLHQNYEDIKINVLNTPMAEGEKEYLFVVKFCKVSNICILIKKNTEITVLFVSKFNSRCVTFVNTI